MQRRAQLHRSRVAPPCPANVPTTPPHPVPGGEYDRDGFLYKCPVENFRHDLIRTELAATLRPRLARQYGDRAILGSDVGLYHRPEDRFAPPLSPDILVSLTAGAMDTPGTPPAEDRKSYKLWQEPVPDLVIEIVSPSSGERDTTEKPNRYESIGIPEYWIFDPERHRIVGGLSGRLLIDGAYTSAPPATLPADQAPVPRRAIPYWSAVLGLYLYADGVDLRLHDPRTGRVNTVAEEIAAREAAEGAHRAAVEARRAAEDSQRAAEEARRLAEDRYRTTEEARRLAEDRYRTTEEARRAAEDRYRTTEEARRAAEDRQQVAEEARRAAEDRYRTTEQARRAAEDGQQAAEEAWRAAELQAKRETARARALEAELRALRQRS